MNTWQTGLRLSEQAEDLRPLFREWINVYSLATQKFPQTEGRWYVEQTLSSLLVGASWRLGIPGISEVRVKRSLAQGLCDGRADILLDMNGARTAFEAKIGWFNNLDGFDAVPGKLEDACAQASTFDESIAGRRFGICFGMMEKGGEPIEILLQNSLKRAEASSLDFVVWAADIASLESVRFPGCVAIGRLVR